MTEIIMMNPDTFVTEHGLSKWSKQQPAQLQLFPALDSVAFVTDKMQVNLNLPFKTFKTTMGDGLENKLANTTLNNNSTSFRQMSS